MRPVELALEALRPLGIAPLIRPIRGGTDGALTAKGVPDPQSLHGDVQQPRAAGMDHAATWRFVQRLNLARLWARPRETFQTRRALAVRQRRTGAATVETS